MIGQGTCPRAERAARPSQSVTATRPRERAIRRCRPLFKYPHRLLLSMCIAAVNLIFAEEYCSEFINLHAKDGREGEMNSGVLLRAAELWVLYY